MQSSICTHCEKSRIWDLDGKTKVCLSCLYELRKRGHVIDY